jgi:cell division protein FtsW
MGQNATLNTNSKRINRVSKSEPKSTRLKIDVTFLLTTITLIVYGMIMVYSASYSISFYVSETKSPNDMFVRQISWLALGLALMLIFALIDYRKWQKFTVIGMVITILALIAVLIFGGSGDNPSRNIIGGSYQPSELAKLMIVIYLSVWMHSKRETLSDIHFGLFPLAGILGIVGGLIIGQPDLSAGATVIILGGIMFFIAGGDWKQIGILIIAAMVMGFFVIQINTIGKERVGEFLLGLKNPLESSDHVIRALSAFANGGWFGVGIGQGTIKLTILPVPHTDSIFAVIGEELGFLGSGVVVCLFLLFVWRGIVIARKAPDGLGSLLAAGIAIWISMEAFMNVLALTGLLPFAGNPLPFFSIGGSSLVSTLIGVGIILNVSRQSEISTLEKERRTSGAIVDLRGRDWRRSVSRSRRSRSTRI